MFKFRSLLALLALFLSVAFVPASMAGPTKQWAVAMPAVIPAGLGVQFQMLVYNLTPNGNSYINSLKITPVANVSFANIPAVINAGTGTATVTYSSADGSITLNNFSGIGPNKSLTFTLTADVTAVGCTSRTFDYTTFVATTGNALQGDTFLYLPNAINSATSQTYSQLMVLIGCDGVINCGDAISAQFLGAGVQNGSRGLFNKDGSACVKVGFNFTNTISATNDVLMQWDTGSQPNANFTYTAFWNPEWVGANGVPTSTTKVAWYVGGVLTTPVAGRACVGSSLPAPYGTIVSYSGNTTSGSLVIFVPSPLTAGWATAPTSTTLSFPVQIGKERLQLTYVSQTAVSGGANYTYSAQRNVNWTGTLDGLSANEFVMSNPLPLDGSNKQMQMCIVDEGYTTVNASLCPQATISNPPVACVQKSDTAFDLGDGYMVGN